MRKSIDTLSYLVEPLLAQKPASGNLFVFVGRDRTKVKCLYWDRTGFALWYNQLASYYNSFSWIREFWMLRSLAPLPRGQ